jgi:hypothetical protein
MKQRLRSKVWWPGIDRQAEKVGREYFRCQLTSNPTKPEPMARIELPNAPWEHLACDLLGPLPSGDYIFDVVDYYSRFLNYSSPNQPQPRSWFLYCLGFWLHMDCPCLLELIMDLNLSVSVSRIS